MNWVSFRKEHTYIKLMKKHLLTFMAFLSIPFFSLRAQNKPLETVGKVDLQKYLGKWYEIAAFPQIFEKGCTCTIAQYSLKSNGDITVKNTCKRNGKITTANGRAVVKDKTTNAKLSVSFFWPFSGKYWIIALAPDYSYAMVGHPNRKYLWILSRKPKMDEATYHHLTALAASKGFDLKKLVTTDQSCN